MKLSTKVALILALILIVAGAALFFGAASTMNFDLRKASMTAMVTNTYDITDEFTSISVNAGECTVNLLPSEDNTCKVVVLESKKVHHTVNVAHDRLIINRLDERNLIDYIGLYFYPLEINIYLPQKELDNININIDSGTIDINGVTCQEVTATMVSGSILLSNCYADIVDLETTSGYIGLFNSDGKSIAMKAVNGSINANLQSGKTFSVRTTSGSITVPPDSSPDTCTATTVIGNIYISVIQ